MKIRNGFVSNSSTSSFVCDFCGCVEADRDCSLSDFDMSCCEHGHEFCNDHMEKTFEDESIDGFKYLKKLVEQDKFYCIKRDNKSSLIIEILDECINEDKCDFETFQQKLEDKDEDYSEEFDIEDYMYDIKYDEGIPEEYCPVCQRAKKMKEDTEWVEYERLYKKFNEVDPYGRK